MKPVMYLDVDGVLWDIQQRLKDDPTIIVAQDPTTFACGARGLEDFVDYMLEKFLLRNRHQQYSLIQTNYHHHP